MPISYAKLFELLKEKGYTTYKIRQEKLIGQGTLTALKNGTGGLDAKTIARLCELSAGILDGIHQRECSRKQLISQTLPALLQQAQNSRILS